MLITIKILSTRLTSASDYIFLTTMRKGVIQELLPCIQLPQQKLDGGRAADAVIWQQHNFIDRSITIVAQELKGIVWLSCSIHYGSVLQVAWRHCKMEPVTYDDAVRK